MSHKPQAEKGFALVELALYQPDIPQNTGTLVRLAACLGLRLHVILPAGFIFSDRRLKQAGMDYIALAAIQRHASFADFEAWRAQEGRRLIAMTTRAETTYTDFAFAPGDILLAGRESAGLPQAVHTLADARLRIPQRQGRSLNVAVASAMVLGEALRQTGGFANEGRQIGDEGA